MYRSSPAHKNVNAKMESTQAQEAKDSLVKRWTKIFMVVAAYWFISISMVFMNKYLLSSDDLKLNAPLFITLSQCIVSSIVVALLGLLVQDRYPSIDRFPRPEYYPATALRILPLSIVFVAMITFNNYTLKFLGVAFYNVGRSLTTVFNVSLSYLLLGQSLSCAVISCCGIIVSGFVLGIKEEDESVGEKEVGQSISVIGVVCGVLASLSVALYAINTKRVLPHVSDSIWRLQIYNNINAIFLLTPLMLLFGEVPILLKFTHWKDPYFWFLMVVAGVFGVAIGYMTALQIKVTSPLTHNVSGTAKACAQTILACEYYSESKSLWWWASNAMVLGGSSTYTYVRMMEMKATSEKSSKPLEIVEQGQGSNEGSTKGT